MAFNFKLERVLEYRRQLEEQAILALSRARIGRDKEKARFDGLRAELAQQRFILGGSAGMPGAERWLVVNYISALERDVKDSGIRLHYLELAVEQSRQELVEKARERRLLDKLKDKQAARHAKEEQLKEQRGYDETTTIRFKQKALQAL